MLHERRQTQGSPLSDSIYMKCPEQADPERQKTSGCLGSGIGANEE